MKYLLSVRVHSALLLGFFLGLAGCSRAPSETVSAAPIAVAVSYPVEREVTDYAEFTARTAAVDSVEVRAHSWGYLDKVNFKEGALVEKGAVLFELDPRPYEAMLQQAEAKVAQDKAQLAFDEAEYRRNRELIAVKAVSKSDLDKSEAARGVDIANVAADKALAASRLLDLEYTKIKAPVSGRVSRYYVTVGNLIQSAEQANVTLLTTIVSVDPMYAYFDVDERTVQHVWQWLRKDKPESAADAALPVALGLATEEGFPHQGTIDFVDNQVNPKTGTLRVRGKFSNLDETLTAGFFARVRLPIGPPRKALLVSDRAVDADQGQKILYVVNERNEVVTRKIRVGALHDGLRAVEEGLKAGERVVVNGLQQVRPGITVEPSLVEMPKSNPKTESLDSKPSQVSKSE
jgi:RND family efflux transporter MFP subunit